jgi:hypothetical protein
MIDLPDTSSLGDRPKKSMRIPTVLLRTCYGRFTLNERSCLFVDRAPAGRVKAEPRENLFEFFDRYLICVEPDFDRVLLKRSSLLQYSGSCAQFRRDRVRGGASAHAEIEEDHPLCIDGFRC